MSSLRHTYKQPLYWGLLHGINDFAAGYMLAHYMLLHGPSNGFLLLVLYAIIGFGGQLPVGFWLDSRKELKPFVWASLLLLPLGMIAYGLHAPTGIIIAGLSSAWLHVTGGTVCLQQRNDKAGPLALFTAPGVLGLTLGGALGSMGYGVLLVALAATVLVSWTVLRSPLPTYQKPAQPQSQLDAHDWLMLGILVVMCFRSFLFDVINQVAHLHPSGIIIIGISAFAGKIIGGYAADAIGWKKYVYISLPLALLLFQFGKQNIVALSFGVACLQSSVPITLMLMARSLPLYPATATALSLGTSVALAGLPLYMASSGAMVHWFQNNWASLGFFVLILALAYVVLKFFPRKISLPEQYPSH
jgi:MFS transporter, FSR family, fosmidomycin resistance protein